MSTCICSFVATARAAGFLIRASWPSRLEAAMMVAEPLFKQLQSESQFQSAVTQYAALKQWQWMHIRPGLNERGRYRTPVSGALGSGWPDLVLVRNSRLLFVELKAQKGKVTGLQQTVLGVLGAIPCAEVYVWRPSDWDLIMEVLS